MLIVKSSDCVWKIIKKFTVTHEVGAVLFHKTECISLDRISYLHIIIRTDSLLLPFCARTHMRACVRTHTDTHIIDNIYASAYMLTHTYS